MYARSGFGASKVAPFSNYNFIITTRLAITIPSGDRELTGITAKENLEKARTMFEEMNLQLGLDELDEIVASG